MLDTQTSAPAAPPGNLPSFDLLPDGFVWTPEIERLANVIGQQIRLDSPGMLVSGAQRNGKSSACAYLAAVLPSVIGYPLNVVVWRIPGDQKYTTRSFLQERLAQCGYGAITHKCVFHAIADTVPLGWRTAFRRDGGHRSTLIADGIPN